MTVETHALLATLTVLAVAVIVRLVRRQVLKAKYTVLWLTVGLVLAITASVPTLLDRVCLLYTSPSPRDKRQSRMPSSA